VARRLKLHLLDVDLCSILNAPVIIKLKTGKCFMTSIPVKKHKDSDYGAKRHNRCQYRYASKDFFN
jgi:hypothetical protein